MAPRHREFVILAGPEVLGEQYRRRLRRAGPGAPGLPPTAGALLRSKDADEHDQHDHAGNSRHDQALALLRRLSLGTLPGFRGCAPRGVVGTSARAAGPVSRPPITRYLSRGRTFPRRCGPVRTRCVTARNSPTPAGMRATRRPLLRRDYVGIDARALGEAARPPLRGLCQLVNRALQIAGQRLVVGIALAGRPLQHAHDYPFDRFADVRPAFAQVPRVLLQALPYDFLRGLPAERRPPAQRVIQRPAERIDVGTLGDLLLKNFLRRYVIRTPPDPFGRLLVRERRQAEIDQFRLHVLREQYVLRFDVTVHQADRRCGAQPRRHIQARLHHEGLVKVFVRDHQLLQRFALDELHDDVGLALLVTEGVDLRDVRVIELCRRLCLAIEALDHGLVGSHGCKQHLYRHLTIEHRVGAAIDGAHPAGADPLQQHVVAELRGNGLFGAALRAGYLGESLEIRHIKHRLAAAAPDLRYALRDYLCGFLLTHRGTPDMEWKPMVSRPRPPCLAQTSLPPFLFDLPRLLPSLCSRTCCPNRDSSTSLGMTVFC